MFGEAKTIGYVVWASPCYAEISANTTKHIEEKGKFNPLQIFFVRPNQ